MHPLPALQNNNSKGTNGMHNNIPLTKEHQMMLGEGEVKPTQSNPRGFSKRQLTVLSFFKDREVKMNSNQSNDDGYFRSWGNEKNSFRGTENNYKNGFNLNMFQSPGEGTSTRDPNIDTVEDSTIVKTAVAVIKKIAGKVQFTDIVVHLNTMQINSIGKILLLDYQGRINPWSAMHRISINMIAWHQLPSDLLTGFHEGSDEVLLALYKINEVIFDAIVIYPYKIRNVESGEYEYKENSFMRFIPHERNKHDKIFNESGFYRSRVVNITTYFEEFTRIQRDESADTRNKDLFVFAMYYDFMSYVAQTLQGYFEAGVALSATRRNLLQVIKTYSALT